MSLFLRISINLLSSVLGPSVLFKQPMFQDMIDSELLKILLRDKSVMIYWCYLNYKYYMFCTDSGGMDLRVRSWMTFLRFARMVRLLLAERCT